MGQVQTALRCSEWALEFMSIGPMPVLFMLAVVSLVWAALNQRSFHSGLWKRSHWLCLSHLLFFPAAIALGTLGPSIG